jgi:hypothetical protein
MKAMLNKSFDVLSEKTCVPGIVVRGNGTIGQKQPLRSTSICCLLLGGVMFRQHTGNACFHCGNVAHTVQLRNAPRAMAGS